MGVAAAVVGAGVIGAAASIYGSQAQADAMTNAANLQHQMYEQNVGYEQPYTNFGQQAMGSLQSGTNTLGNFLGMNGTGAQSSAMAGYQNSPFFQQMQTNAANATMAQYAGQGGMGGNALTALNQQNAALNYSQYNNYLNQISGYLGGLQGQVNTGLSATNALAGVGTQSAATQGNLVAGAGAATGAGIVGAGANTTGALNNVAMLSVLSQGQGGAGGSGQA